MVVIFPTAKGGLAAPLAVLAEYITSLKLLFEASAPAPSKRACTRSESLLPLPSVAFSGFKQQLSKREAQEGKQMLGTYGFFGWIIIGAVAGILAKVIMPGRDPGGCIVTILLGIGGALVAGFIGNAVGWYTQGQAGGFIAATLGAILILFVYRLLMRRR